MIAHQEKRMLRQLGILALQLFALTELEAQELSWRVVGNPPGASAGCTNAAAVSAITSFVAALNAADSAGLARATTPYYNREFTFSTGKFTPTDTFTLARTLPELLRYARKRANKHERIELQRITFNDWRGHWLNFGPIYFLRSADDLGKAALPGVGKGVYWCGKGIFVWNTGPRPSYDRGPGG
jgi:hypothetical protein